MADPTTYHRIILKFESPFPKRLTDGQIWTLKFSLSGAALTSSADAAATAMDLADDVLAFCATTTSYIGWRYYAAGSTINEYGLDYETGAYPGTKAAYSDPGSLQNQQLEVCVLARCYVKQSSKGRPVYLGKHIHDVFSGTESGEVPALVAGTLHHFNTGAGPDALVPVDPTSGQAGTGWSVQAALYTRQLRKGVKP